MYLQIPYFVLPQAWMWQCRTFYGFRLEFKTRQFLFNGFVGGQNEGVNGKLCQLWGGGWSFLLNCAGRLALPLWSFWSFFWGIQPPNPVKTTLIKMCYIRGLTPSSNMRWNNVLNWLTLVTMYLFLAAANLNLKEPSPIFSTFSQLLEILVSQESSYFSHNQCKISLLKSVAFGRY